MTYSHTDRIKPIIWLVENDLLIASDIQKHLRSQGYQVKHFLTPDKAAERVGKTQKPCVVITDYLSLEGGNKLLTQALCKKGWEELPIIKTINDNTIASVEGDSHEAGYSVEAIKGDYFVVNKKHFYESQRPKTAPCASQAVADIDAIIADYASAAKGRA